MRKFIGLIKVFKLLLLILLLNTLYACAIGPLYKEVKSLNADSNMAYIYIYRPSLGGVINDFEVLINNQLIGNLKSYGYIVVAINPGEYIVTIQLSDKSIFTYAIKKNIMKGESIYIKFLSDSVIFPTEAKIIPSEVAKKEIGLTLSRLQNYVDFTKLKKQPLKEKQCKKKCITNCTRFRGVEAGCER